MTQLDTHFLDSFHRLGAKEGEPYGAAPARKLALLIRPTFVARPGKTLVWGDWANIEARVLPWLADSRGAEKKLDIFRQTDADPSLPDIYIRTAADLTGLDAQQLWDAYKAGDREAEAMRQAQGKVPELSLGFGGSLGALMNMATNYGVYVSEQQGTEMVERWRAANSWARNFWGGHGKDGSYGLWGAACSALEQPGDIFTAGRVAYVYDRDYLGGTLFCGLPSGKTLTYPRIKWETREVEDRKTKQVVTRTQLTFRKGYGRSALWYGKLAENVTQAVAASVLRGTLTKLEYEGAEPFDGYPSTAEPEWFRDWMPTVMHTHDEIVTEPAAADADEARELLHEIMVEGFDWSGGLPLAADVSVNWYYTKRKLK